MVITTKLQILVGTSSSRSFLSEKQRQKKKSYKHTYRFKDRISVIQQQKVKRLSSVGAEMVLDLKSDNLRRGCRLQDSSAVQGWSESRQRVVAHHRGGKEARLARVGFENMMRSWVMK